MLGKVAKFGGYSLNGFEVINFFSEGSLKSLPIYYVIKINFRLLKRPLPPPPTSIPRPLPKK